MKWTSWTSVVSLTVATAVVTLAGPPGCGNEESSGGNGGLLDGGAGAGGAGSGIVVGHSTILGTACETDADCEGGLTCVSATSAELASGSPAHGVCTMPCEPGKYTCKEIDEAASCVPFDASTAYCFPGCTFGSPGFGEQKCQGRSDMACAPVFDIELIGDTCTTDAECPTVASTAPPSLQGFVCQGSCVALSLACLPQCNGDADCAQGQHCDLGALGAGGLCYANPPTGLPTGAECDPNANPSPCRGLCEQVTQTTGVCADGCAIGAPATCGWSGTGPADATCQPYYQGEGSGDAGVCWQLCDCNDDCGSTNMACYPFSVGSSYGTKYGRAGFCDAANVGGAGGESSLACAGGATGAGGTSGAGGASGASSGGVAGSSTAGAGG